MMSIMAVPTYLVATAAVSIVLLYHTLGFIRRKQAPQKVLRVSELYVYPIKSLRESRVHSALATRHGFKYDRRFMLLEVTPGGLENMLVANYPIMTQFLTSIDYNGEHSGTITVKFLAPGRSDKPESLSIPLVPNTEELDTLDINMHGSPTTTYKMQAHYNQWFSSCFGFDVVLVYLGENRRDVLFDDLVPAKSATWQSTIKRAIPFVNSIYSMKHQITFADCAPYLITSKTSLANASERLPEGQDAKMIKFRPNIVVEGADRPWEEDFWHMVRIGDADFAMLHNCIRCQSINIDYTTGKPGTDESGQLLKKLQKDRRVDKGSKWSPVFGRYSFWASGDAQKTLSVGNPVQILEVNKERSVWNWPGL